MNQKIRFSVLALAGMTVVGCGSNSSDGQSKSAVTSSCDPNAWVDLTSNANACAGNLGESCGWTATNEGQGYHCASTSWGTGCAPGGQTCPGGGAGSGVPTSGANSGACGGSSSGGASGSGGGSSASGPSSGGPTGAPANFVFSPYKDCGTSANWNTSVCSTVVSGPLTPIASDLKSAGGDTITLAFAAGECGSEQWAYLPGAAFATANMPLITGAGVKYILSTGGAAGVFTCGSDSGFATFVGRWASPNLVGVDFDIEAPGESAQVIGDLLTRIQAAHAGAFSSLRFSLTIATFGNNNGGDTAQSLGASAPDNFGGTGDLIMAQAKSVWGFSGSNWPSYVTVNLMVMDYGKNDPSACVVNGGTCDMGQSALQAAYNLHDHWGIPYSNIELTPDIGQNDSSDEQFTLKDADTLAAFAQSQQLGGIHYWSYDRDTPTGTAASTMNGLGGGVGPYAFFKEFKSHGM